MKDAEQAQDEGFIPLFTRIPQHKQFVELAQRGQILPGWFYDRKLRLTVNECSELLSWIITPGHCKS